MRTAKFRNTALQASVWVAWHYYFDFVHHEDHEGHEGFGNFVLKLRAVRVLLRKYLFGDENKEARLASVIPAKAGIQVNSAQRTWIPACAGQPSNLGLIRPSAEMTSRGERHVEGNPSIFILGGRA